MSLSRRLTRHPRSQLTSSRRLIFFRSVCRPLAEVLGLLAAGSACSACRSGFVKKPSPLFSFYHVIQTYNQNIMYTFWAARAADERRGSGAIFGVYAKMCSRAAENTLLGHKKALGFASKSSRANRSVFPSFVCAAAKH